MTEYFKHPNKQLSIDHRNSVLLIGSCFSEHIGRKMQRVGFDVLSNPYGTIFHPIPLGNCLERISHSSERFLQQDDVWLSYDAASGVYALSENDLRNRLLELDLQLKQFLSVTKIVIITFGSAHGYRLKRDELIVANCHRQPSSLFVKELTDVAEMAEKWKAVLDVLKRNYPELTVLVTVSPVRYSRDGWIKNNRSKSRLLQLAEYLEETMEYVHYFPAYELVNDILRDYRYFEADGVHPNEQAVNAVWELFSDWFFSPDTKRIIQEAEEIRRMEEHRLLFPESRQAAIFHSQLQQKRESFLSLHPYIRWK